MLYKTPVYNHDQDTLFTPKKTCQYVYCEVYGPLRTAIRNSTPLMKALFFTTSCNWDKHKTNIYYSFLTK